MYADGLIDNEWLTQDRNAAWEKINSEAAGYFVSSVNSLNSWAIDRPPLTLIEKNPEVKLLMTPGLVGSDGTTMQRKNSSPIMGRAFINAKITDNRKIAKILQFLEYTNFGPDSVTLFYGEEGVNWEWKDDKPFVTNPLLNGVNGTKSFIQYMQVGDLWKWITYEPVFEKGAKYYVLDEGGIWNKGLVFDYKEDVRSETNYNSLSVEYGPDVSAVVNAYYMDVILGKKDADATWDEYLCILQLKKGPEKQLKKGPINYRI